MMPWEREAATASRAPRPSTVSWTAAGLRMTLPDKCDDKPTGIHTPCHLIAQAGVERHSDLSVEARQHHGKAVAHEVSWVRAAGQLLKHPHPTRPIALICRRPGDPPQVSGVQQTLPG